MADSDFNTIKPVESLQNIQGLDPAARRQGRNRRQNGQAGNHEEPPKKPDDTEDRATLDDGQSHTIDYCA